MFYVSVYFMFSSPKFPQTSVGITRDNTYSIPRNNYSWRAFLKRKQKMHVSFDWTRFVISDVLSFFFLLLFFISNYKLLQRISAFVIRWFYFISRYLNDITCSRARDARKKNAKSRKSYIID